MYEKIEPVEIVVVPLTAKDQFNLYGREEVFHLFPVVIFHPWCPRPVGRLSPFGEGRRALAQPARFGIGKVQPTSARFEVRKQGFANSARVTSLGALSSEPSASTISKSEGNPSKDRSSRIYRKSAAILLMRQRRSTTRTLSSTISAKVMRTPCSAKWIEEIARPQPRSRTLRPFSLSR